MQTLDRLTKGASARICRLEACGAVRSRLQDIGLIPGTRVTCVQTGAGIAAYSVRGAVIALRDSDAAGIWIEQDPIG